MSQLYIWNLTALFADYHCTYKNSAFINTETMTTATNSTTTLLNYFIKKNYGDLPRVSMDFANWSEEPRLVIGGEAVGEGWGDVRRSTLVICDHK